MMQQQKLPLHVYARPNLDEDAQDKLGEGCKKNPPKFALFTKLWCYILIVSKYSLYMNNYSSPPLK